MRPNVSIVLLIEAQEDLREMLYQFLLFHNYIVVKALSLRQGMQFVRAIDFDIILCGLETVKQCRDLLQEARKTNPIPAIAFSTNCTEKDKENALVQGFNDFFTRPFDLKDLEERMTTLLYTDNRF